MHPRLAVSAALVAAAVGAAAPVTARAAAETFTATATVKTAAGTTASSPVTIVIDRTTPEADAERVRAAFASGGLPALHKALAALPSSGSIRVGRTKTATKITLERPTDKGRLLTIVTAEPIAFVGAGVSDAKAKAGYDFAVIDIEVDAAGNGSGTLAPAAKVALKGGAFVVSDYGSELVRLTEVKKAK